MRLGTFKKKYFAASFVFHQVVKKNSEGDVEKDEAGAAVLEEVKRKNEVVYFSDVSETDAVAGLEAHMIAKGYTEDLARNESQEKMKSYASMERFVAAASAKEKESFL